MTMKICGFASSCVMLIMPCSFLFAQPALPLNAARVSHVPFGSKKNTIELVVMNKGAEGAQEFVVSTYDAPTWIHYVREADTLRFKLKDEQSVARLEFSVDPTAPVGGVTALHFIVAGMTGERWTKDLNVMIEAPKQFALLQNYPNPFNPLTVISYDLPYKINVSLQIYDLLGREIVTLVDGEQEAGHQEKTFDASELSSGVYFYKLRAGNYTAVKKLMLLK